MPTSEDLAYQSFLRSVQPFVVGLESCSAKVDRSAFWRLRKNQKEKVVNKLSAEYRLVKAKDDYFDVRGQVVVTIGDDGEPPLVMLCEFNAHFHSTGQVQESFAERFAQTEARLFLWPYFREFISSLTSRMGIPPVMLPLTLAQIENRALAPAPAAASAAEVGRSSPPRKSHAKKRLRTKARGPSRKRAS